MAKKKTPVKSSKGINLLKGITGSQLAKLVVLLVILLAVPLTVNSLLNRTNLQQNASGNQCGSPCYTYIKATDSCKYKCTSGQVCTAGGCAYPTTTTKKQPTPTPKPPSGACTTQCVRETATMYCATRVSGSCSSGKVCCDQGGFKLRE
jgi:hypothetical protein